MGKWEESGRLRYFFKKTTLSLAVNPKVENFFGGIEDSALWESFKKTRQPFGFLGLRKKEK
jgi:hypothetical protein